MAYQIYTTTLVGAGVQASLGTLDDVFVGADSFLASTDTYAIRGLGSDHSVDVEGTVVGYDEAIVIGSDLAANSGQEIVIGENALVKSLNSTTLFITGYHSTIENNGILRGYAGINFSGSSSDWMSSLINNGEIICKAICIVRWGSENFEFTNNGLVRSGQSYSFYAGLATGVQSVTNNGNMIGHISLGLGDDTYIGSQGRVIDGTVFGKSGNDIFAGGKYADYFQGDAGRDILDGGGGADHFIFAATGDSTIGKAGRDLIGDFSHAQHDRLDLSGTDAEASSGGTNEAFSFIGTSGFSGAEGELRYKFSGNSTFVQGDTDGDKAADFSIELKGHIALHAGDFVL